MLTRPFLIGIALCAAGCAHHGAGPGVPAAEAFPTQAELAQLEAGPPLALRPLDEVAPISSWKATGPLPTELSEDPLVPSNGLEQRVWALVGGRAPATRQSLGCAAREIGAVLLEHGKLPGQLLEEFILARCGATVAHAQSNRLSGAVPDDASDTDWLARWQEDMQSILAGVPADDRFGFWLGRAKGRAVFLVLHGPAHADVERSALTPGDGKLLLRGRLRLPAERLEARVNRGAWDTADCERLPGPALPDFAFACPLDQTDSFARVELGRWQPARLLGDAVLRIVALPAGTAADTWEKPAALASKGETAQERFVEAVNGLRERAGLAPVTDAPAESASAVRLLPHYLKSQEEGGDARDADRIALGLMAGWHVPEKKVLGQFGSVWGADGTEAGLAEAMVQSPSGRRLLLTPTISRVASAVQAYARGSFGIVSAYRLHKQFADAGEAANVFVSRLNALRAKRGKQPARWSRLPAETEKSAQASLEHGTWPVTVRDRFTQEVVDYTSRAATGWVLQGPSYEEIYLPDALLDAPKLDLVVVAGDSQAGDHPWVQATIVLVEIAPGQGAETAQASAAPPPGLRL